MGVPAGGCGPLRVRAVRAGCDREDDIGLVAPTEERNRVFMNSFERQKTSTCVNTHELCGAGVAGSRWQHGLLPSDELTFTYRTLSRILRFFLEGATFHLAADDSSQQREIFHRLR